jgi:hypothetical protein
MRPNEIEGWTVRGELPAFVPEEGISAETLETLDEDLLQVLRSEPGGDVLDVGWYPSNDASGSFRCRIIRGEVWDAPLEEYETRDPRRACTWVETRMRDVGSEFGEAGEFGQPERVTLILDAEQFEVIGTSIKSPVLPAPLAPPPTPLSGSRSRQMRLQPA